MKSKNAPKGTPRKKRYPKQVARGVQETLADISKPIRQKNIVSSRRKLIYIFRVLLRKRGKYCTSATDKIIGNIINYLLPFKIVYLFLFGQQIFRGGVPYANVPYACKIIEEFQDDKELFRKRLCMYLSGKWRIPDDKLNQMRKLCHIGSSSLNGVTTASLHKKRIGCKKRNY